MKISMTHYSAAEEAEAKTYLPHKLKITLADGSVLETQRAAARGGVADPLRRSRLSLDAATLRLDLDRADHALYGEIVSKRHAALAGALGRVAVSNAAGRG